MTPDRSRRLLLDLLALALVLRVGFIFYLEPGRIYFRDTVKYDAAAESLLAGEGLGKAYARQPLYPIYLAGVYALFPDQLLAAQLAEALLGCLAVFLTYLVGRRIWSEEVGLFGAGLVAVHPYLLILPAFVYAEILFTVLLLTSLWLLLEAPHPGRVLAAGLLAGAAALTKASGLALIAAGAVWLLVFGARRFGRRALLSASFVGSAALLLTPWVNRNMERYHNLTLIEARKEVHVTFDPRAGFPLRISVLHPEISPKAKAAAKRPRRPGGRVLNAEHVIRQLRAFWTLWPENLATAKREVREKAASKDPRAVVEGHPVEGMGRYRTWISLALLPYYLLAAAGAWSARRRLRRSSLLMLLVAAFTLGRVIFVAKLRYRLPIEPALALFAAAGVTALAQLFPRPRPRRRPAGTPVAPEPAELVSADRA